MGSNRPSAPFQPKRHDKLGVRQPFSARQRKILPADELARLHAKNAERQDRFSRFGSRSRARAKAYLIGAPFAMLFWMAMFTPVGFSALHVQLPLYAAWALYLAFVRPVGAHAMGVTILTGVLAIKLSGVYVVAIFMPVTMLFLAVLGRLVSIDEEGKWGLGDR